MGTRTISGVLPLAVLFHCAAGVAEPSPAFEDLVLGARPVALAGAFVGLAEGAGAIFVNSAGLAPCSTISATSFYSRPFGLRELDISALALAFPVRVARLGFAVRMFGRNPYQERTLYAACARALSPALRCGVTVKYYEVSIEKYGRASALGIDIGLRARLSPALRWGVGVQNINRPRIYDSRDPLPQQFTAGCSLEPVAEVTIVVDVAKDVRYPAELRCGAECRISDFLCAQIGIRNNPSRFSCGLSLLLRSLRMDYALSSHYDLGITHAFSLSYCRGTGE